MALIPSAEFLYAAVILRTPNDKDSVLGEELYDIRLSGEYSFCPLRTGWEIRRDLPVIVTTAPHDCGRVISAYDDGYFEYLTEPFDAIGMSAGIAEVSR